MDSSPGRDIPNSLKIVLSKQCGPRSDLLDEQSDQGLQCLPFGLHFLDGFFYSKATLFKF